MGSLLIFSFCKNYPTGKNMDIIVVFYVEFCFDITYFCWFLSCQQMFSFHWCLTCDWYPLNFKIGCRWPGSICTNTTWIVMKITSWWHEWTSHMYNAVVPLFQWAQIHLLFPLLDFLGLAEWNIVENLKKWKCFHILLCIIKC